jgi:hypothetical protein
MVQHLDGCGCDGGLRGSHGDPAGKAAPSNRFKLFDTDYSITQ